jgi:Domain of unknown function (DUF4397)
MNNAHREVRSRSLNVVRVGSVHSTQRCDMKAKLLKPMIALLVVWMVSPAFAANVRVSHLAPRAPAVDVYLNGQRAFSDIPFRTVTAYLQIKDGVYDVSIYATGERTNPILEAKGLDFENHTYTITAAGFGPEKSQRPAVFIDDLAPSADFARLRIINATPDAPTIDLALRGSLALLKGVGFKDASNYLRFGPGNLELEIRFPGTPEGVLELPSLKLEAGKVYTVFIVGYRGDGTLNYVLTEDKATK